MPKIKPFRGIRPHPAFVDKVVLQVENLSLASARLIREDNPYSYVNMLVPKLEHPFMRGSKRELTYKKINENLTEFLDKGILIRDSNPCLYVYRIIRQGIHQTGIWTITSIDDYLDNSIKKHELTQLSRQNALIEYLGHTGVDANPVLITYRPISEINAIIEKTVQQLPDLYFDKEQARHELWKIDQEPDLSALVQAFAHLESSYIADGHHRAAAASALGIEKRRLNLKHTGQEDYNFFTSVYMATDQLQIFSINRLIRNLGNMSAAAFLDKLAEYFHISVSEQPVEPAQFHEFGLYLGKKWYKLLVKSWPQVSSPVEELDVSILQDYVFSKILGISDPRTDSRICFMAGLNPLDHLMEEVDQGNCAAAFTLFPTSVNQLMRIADAGEIMPPKSTWFEPKFQAGLIIHQIN